MAGVYRRPYRPQPARIRRSRWVGTKTAGGPTFNDTGTGTITLSGTATSSQTHSGSGSGTVTFTGTSTLSTVYTDARTGTITLSGTSTRSASYADSRTGTVTLSGTGVENYVPPSSGVTVFFHDPTPELSRVVLHV